ncbi:hypothetical protein [Lachnotalea glycerini]|nr:hypothetical protein [Lachnotalea glycerini]
MNESESQKKIKRQRSRHLILPDMLTNGNAMSERKRESEENQATAKQAFDFT